MRSKIKISQATADLAEKTKGLFLNSENVTHGIKVSACSFYAWLWPALTWTQHLRNVVFYTTAKLPTIKLEHGKPSISSRQWKLSLSPDH